MPLLNAWLIKNRKYRNGLQTPLKICASKKNQAHRSMKENPHNNEAAKKFKLLRDKFGKSVKKAKTDFFAQKFESCIGDSRQTYKLLNDTKGITRKSSQVPALNSCNARCTDPSGADIAEEFNTFFTNVGPKLKYNIKPVPLTKMDEVNHSMYLKPITCDEVREIIDNLDNKISSGDDDISNVIVKLSSNVTIPYLTQIINLSFEEGIFPDDLKKAKVIPLHKDGSKIDENNYRPISLLIVWSKIIERALFIRIYACMEYHNLFFNRQFGFRTKHSTIDALVELVEKIRLNCRNVKAIGFYRDLKKAFDTIEHDILLKKIENTGIRGPALSWVTTYLKGRQQRVIINGAFSSWKSIVCGVPQGSILGPLLFLIYIKDLPLVCKSLDVILFADDTNLTAINKDDNSVQEDLQSISNWLIAYKLILNMDKTVQMNIRNKNSASKSVFKFDDVSIEVRNLCKYLGIYVDSKLSFQSHIEYIKKRLSKPCAIICKLRQYVPRKQPIDYYRSNLNPIIQYGILVYGCCSYSSVLLIYILQKKILKFIYFRKRSDSSRDIFISNKLLTVFEFHVYELLQFVLKSLS